MKRLGDGTEISNKKLQDALNHLYPYSSEMYSESEIEKEMKELGIGADLSLVKSEYLLKSEELFLISNITVSNMNNRMPRGKEGIHSK
jgi:ring-1,2-phenylacetyl-CoA epoxidase subunit PaaC